MDLVSKQINDEVLTQVAEEFDISEKDVKRLLKVHADYVYDKINSIDLRRDLSKQGTRIVLINLAAIYVDRIILVENDLKYGHILPKFAEYLRNMLKGRYKKGRLPLENYKLMNKID
jgi:hypothetical protein